MFSGSIAAQTMSVHAEPALPSGREFLTSAGFGGVAALLAAIIVAVVLVVQGRSAREHRAHELEQREQQHADQRADRRRAAALAAAWRRLQWVVDTAGIEPASSQGITLGLGPELASEILRGILRDADELGDEALGNAATVHLSQLSMVLAQQSGSLPQPAAAAAPAKPATPPKAPANAAADGATEEKADPAKPADETTAKTPARARRATS